jgi:opacity protein-like surface antigen
VAASLALVIQRGVFMRRIHFGIGHIVRFVPLLIVILGLIVSGVTPARAQTPATNHVFVGALSGLTLGDTRMGATFSGTGGYAWSSHHIQVAGEIGHLDNVLPMALQHNLQSAALTLSGTPDIGGPITFSAKLPATYGLGMVRVSGSTRHAVIPFVEGGAGAAHVNSNVTAEASGIDESSLLLESVTLPGAETKPLLALGGGVSFTVKKRASVDVGYRFGRILTTESPLDMNRLYGGFKYRF